MTDVATSLNEALALLIRMAERKNEPMMRHAAKSGNAGAQRVVEHWDKQDGGMDDYPRYRADGSPIGTLDEVSAAMGTTRHVAARYVLDYKDDTTTESLIGEAENELKLQQTEHTGFFLGLLPRDPKPFIVPGGVPEDEIHCTLFYSDTLDGMEDAFITEAKGLSIEEITASVNGQTVFYNGDASKVPFVLNVDSPEIEVARRKVMSVFGARCDSEHGYSPHITVGFIDRDAKFPKFPREPIDVVFDKVRVNANGVTVDLPLVPKPQEQLDVETKVRHVRTPAGVAYYHLPIGSPIVAHPRKHVTRKHADTGSKVNGSGATSLREAVNKQLSLSWSGQRLKVTQLKTKRGWYAAYSKNEHGRQKIRVANERRGRIYKFDVTADEKALTPKEIQAKVDLMIKTEDTPLARQKKHGSQIFEREDWGVRGVDWNYDDDPMHDWEDVKKREAIVEADEEELGLIIPALNKDGRQVSKPPVFLREVFVNAARTYDDWYPDFNNYVNSQYGMLDRPDPRVPGGWIAYNDGLPYREDDESFLDSEIMYNGYGVFPKGASEQEILDSAARANHSTVTSGWGAVNGFALAEKLRPNDPQRGMAEAMYLKTTHHEIGHTIARFLIGGFEDPSRRMNKLLGEGSSDQFLTELGELMKDHGIVPKDFHGMLLPHLSGSFDKVKMKQAVSEYAAKSLHEMLAEIWASYVLNDYKTDYVQQAGELMDEWFTKMWDAWD